MRRRKDVWAENGWLVHVETPNGIVNIFCGLKDDKGHVVDAVEIVPDNYPGEGACETDRGVRGIRIVRALEGQSRAALQRELGAQVREVG